MGWYFPTDQQTTIEDSDLQQTRVESWKTITVHNPKVLGAALQQGRPQYIHVEAATTSKTMAPRLCRMLASDRLICSTLPKMINKFLSFISWNPLVRWVIQWQRCKLSSQQQQRQGSLSRQQLITSVKDFQTLLQLWLYIRVRIFILWATTSCKLFFDFYETNWRICMVHEK